jgi:hypothetical protein
MPTNHVKIGKNVSFLPAKQLVEEQLQRMPNVLLVNTRFLQSQNKLL